LASVVCSHLAAFELLYQTRRRLCDHLGKLSMGWLGRRRSGEVKKILSEDVEEMELFIAHHVPDIVSGLVQPLAVVLFLLSLDWRMALAALAPLPLAAALQRLVFGGDKDATIRRAYHDALEALNGSIVEYVRGMPAVKIFGLTTESFSALRKSALAYKDLIVAITLKQAPPWAVFVVVTGSGLVIVLPFGLWLYLRGSIDFPTLALFLMLGAGYLRPLFKLAMLGGFLGMMGESVERIEAILGEPAMPTAANPKAPKGLDIEFEGVSFDYDGREAIRDLSLRLPEGGTYALVGPSGAGKSTVARLIARMWDPSSGRVLLGGADLREIDPFALNEAVATVFQESVVFSDTIRENIRMGSLRSDEEVLRAAEAARCLDIIERSPEGLDTLVGEGGALHLSGGERQRLSMARAILRAAPVVVLDEATVFNDAENEAGIQSAFAKLATERTVVVIAHRLSTIIDCDSILVLDQGRLAERGTHEELLAAGGLYKSMWEAHQKALDWRLGSREGGAPC
jgi:ATP-binding cassette subfamily B protein